MRISMKRIVAFIAGIAMISTLSACGSSSSTSSKTLNLLVEGGGPAETVARSTAEEFKKETGYSIKIDSVPYSGLYDKLKAETDSGRSIHDLAVIDVGWFPALAKGLSPVSSVLNVSQQNDFMPGLKEGGTINDKLMGIPTWTNAKILLYRKDLFDNKTNKTAFKQKFGYDLTVPTTWKQFRDVARFFTRGSMHGTSFVGQTGADSVTSWLEFSAQAGAKGLVVKNGKSTIKQKPYAQALKYMHSIVADGSVPADYLSEGVSDISNLFNQGKLAMELTWSHFYKSAQKSLGDKVAAAPMIGGSHGIGAIPGPWYEVILKNSPKQQAAQEYLRFMYSKNAQYMTALGVSARKSVFKQYENKPGYAHVKPLEETLAAPQTQNRPPIKAWTQIESEALSPLVQSGLKGANVPKVLDQAEKQVQEILNE